MYIKNLTLAKKAVYGIIGSVGAGGLCLIYSFEKSIAASGGDLKATKYPWSHNGLFKSYDHASIRRGYEVFKNVCAACHGLEFLSYRRMIDVCLTPEEGKKEASEKMYKDGPDDNGEMFERQGLISDNILSPYENDGKARTANNGSLPPDLSLITLARHGGEDYVFSLLTGYCDPPAGYNLPEGNHYNPFFPGGGIGMAAPLYNDILEFGDGTPATLSQCAKDVSTFLSWCASPEHDFRKRVTVKAFILFGLMAVGFSFMGRMKWNSLKVRKYERFIVKLKPKRSIK